MFTGIVQTCAPITTVEKKPGLIQFGVEFSKTLITNLKVGASVAIDGACLTVVRSTDTEVFFDAMEETLRKTTLGTLEKGKRVNIERSATLGDELGGHLISGHVTGMAEIVNVERPENNHVVTFRVPPEYMKYIFPKGFIALDGASLTIVDVDKTACTFTVWLIPETLRVTTFGLKTQGDFVNLEIDSRTQEIVETVEAVLPTLLSR